MKAPASYNLTLYLLMFSLRVLKVTHFLLINSLIILSHCLRVYSASNNARSTSKTLKTASSSKNNSHYKKKSSTYSQQLTSVSQSLDRNAFLNFFLLDLLPAGHIWFRRIHSLRLKNLKNGCYAPLLYTIYVLLKCLASHKCLALYFYFNFCF